MSEGTIVACTEALTDLVDTTRIMAIECDARGWIGSAHTLDTIAMQFDSTRTRLIQEGDDYLAVAWAYVDAGRLTIAQHRTKLARRLSPGGIGIS